MFLWAALDLLLLSFILMSVYKHVNNFSQQMLSKGVSSYLLNLMLCWTSFEREKTLQCSGLAAEFPACVSAAPQWPSQVLLELDCWPLCNNNECLEVTEQRSSSTPQPPSKQKVNTRTERYYGLGFWMHARQAAGGLSVTSYLHLGNKMTEAGKGDPRLDRWRRHDCRSWTRKREGLLHLSFLLSKYILV